MCLRHHEQNKRAPTLIQTNYASDSFTITNLQLTGLFKDYLPRKIFKYLFKI